MVDYVLKVGGSGTGIHYYEDMMKCPHRAYLRHKEVQNQDPLSYNNYNAKVRGSLLHAFMDLHFSGVLKPSKDPASVNFNFSVNPRARDEAENLFKAFRERYPDRDIFGTPWATELDLPEIDLKGDELEKQKDSIFDSVGISPFTCGIDLITLIDYKQIANLKRDFRINYGSQNLKPGYWVIDHKSAAFESRILVDEVINSLQYISYPLAFQAAFPKLKCKGVMQLTLVNTKVPKFILTAIPFPSKEKIKVLYGMFNTITNILDTKEVKLKKATSCISREYGGIICPYLMSGECRRY